jgi:hypothetical protein
MYSNHSKFVNAHTARRVCRKIAHRRRGVASILSMMFMVIFGSLAAAMAVVAHGNMRTANSSLQVNRAMGAAETGLVFALQRVRAEATNFVVEKGVIDGGFAERLWMGGPYLPGDGNVESPGGAGYGIVHAIRDAHLADLHSMIVLPGDQNLPTIDGQFGTLRVRPIALDADDQGNPNTNGPHFRLKYELTAADPDGNVAVRVTSQGVDGTIRRTLQVDFNITKRIEFAVISPSRIMIGKNVSVEGPIGSLFGTEPDELSPPHGHPVRIHSDFYYLDNGLANSLDLFHQKLRDFDVDGDNRLRPNHPVESQGLSGTGFSDVTGDGYVTDFDIFLAHYGNGGVVVYDSELAGQGANFTDDPQLGRLIDFARPDRDGDGKITSMDTLLGYMDGVLDHRDRYAKVHGRLMFAITREEWESAHGGLNYQEVVQGPISPGLDRAPVRFGVGIDELRPITTDMFNSSGSWFKSRAQSGVDFISQVQSQMASGDGELICPHPSLLPEHWGDDGVESWWYQQLCHNNADALIYHPDDPNADETWDWEEVPYGANPLGGVYDYYLRPIFRDMTFTNVFIPKGLNGLFKNCTFVGVTFIDTYPDNEHLYWNIAGQVNSVGELTEFGENLTETSDGQPINPIGSRIHSNNVRFHDCTFLGSISGEKPLHYTHWRNKVQMTGVIRFYLDTDDDDLHEQPDSAVLIALLNGISGSDKAELAKSSILMPGWSTDVGSFISDASADPADLPIVKLRGTIVAGILDIRGNADVHGTLLMTFRPSCAVHPLKLYASECTGAMLGNFSTTIGYFGPDYGDQEGISPDDPDFAGFGEIRLRYDPNAVLPDGIPWPIRMDPIPATYTEGGAL